MLLSAALIAVVLGIRVAAGLLLQQDRGHPSPEDEALRSRAAELHRGAIVVDGHNDVLT